LWNDGDVLFDAQMGEQPRLLDHIPDATAQRSCRHRTHIDPVDQQAPGCRLVEAVDHFEQRRLAATGRSQQDDELTLFDLERDLIDCRTSFARKCFRQSIGNNECHGST
jgi:hypothetical protein